MTNIYYQLAIWIIYTDEIEEEPSAMPFHKVLVEIEKLYHQTFDGVPSLCLHTNFIFHKSKIPNSIVSSSAQ